MLSSPVIRVITQITTRLPTLKGWKAELIIVRQCYAERLLTGIII